MCNHKKKYISGVVLLTFPPKHPWICEKCGAEGVDLEKESHEFKTFKEKYLEESK